MSHVMSSIGHRALKKSLLRTDAAASLPRVLFVSMVWVHVCGAPEQEQVADHKFSLVKHSNTHFQLIQGHIPVTDLSDGFGQGAWERSGHEFSGSGGFGVPDMERFLDRLQDFGRADTLDTAGYRAMFGVQLGEPARLDLKLGLGSTLGRVWTSLYHTELTDDCIIGCGYRDLSEMLEADIKFSYPGC